MSQLLLGQSISLIQLFASPWTAARQASLSITNSWGLLKLMSIESVMPSNHLILCCPLFPHALNLSQHQILFSWVPKSLWTASKLKDDCSFPVSRLFTSGGQSIGASPSASVLPMNIQNWFPLGWTCLISLQSKGLPRVFSNTTVQKHQFFGSQSSWSTLTSVRDYWKDHSFNYTDLCWQSDISAF